MPDERRPGRPEAVDDRRQRVERARRPGVEQDDGAVPDRGRLGQGVGGHRRAGPPRLPVLEHDVGAHVAIAERRQRRQDARVVVARRERAPEPRPRVRRRWRRGSTASASRTSRRQPVVGQERHPGVVEAVVPDQVALVGDAARERRARPPPSGPGGTTSTGRRAPPARRGGRRSRPGRCGRSGCSASNVSATRNGAGRRPLTSPRR